MSAANRSCHRRSRLHRQPHGRPAARARLRGARRRQSRRRPRAPISTHYADDPRLSCEWQDIRDLEPTSPVFAGARYVFHFAGIGDIVPSIEQPIEYMDTNVQGTVRVLECARGGGRARSSSMPPPRRATGSPPTPTREDHPIDPQYPYALSKYQGEQAVFHWHRVYGLPVNSIRIFNAYGTRVRTTGRLRRGVRRVPEAEARRQAVHRGRRRHADARLHLRDRRRARPSSPRPRREMSGERFNVGAGNPQSVNRLVELLGGEVVYVPKRPGEPDCTWADIAQDPIDARLAADGAASRRACSACSRRSTTGATRRCGIRPRSTRRRAPGSSTSERSDSFQE